MKRRKSRMADWLIKTSKLRLNLRELRITIPQTVGPQGQIPPRRNQFSADLR
jgi:hypothetical protein